MPAVAFATYQHYSPEISDDERPVAELLRERGVAVASAVWDDPAVDWSHFDSVIIRSTWDYHFKPHQYETWLRSFMDRPGQLWNPPLAVLQNMHKSYLTTLAENGLEVVPTHCQRRGEEVSLLELLNRYAWKEAVIKPAISASAHGTWRSSLATANADQENFATQLLAQDLLVQPYISEVAAQGEWSLVFFDMQYSHAVLKRPTEGDFRVHREYGGKSFTAEPSPSLINQAEVVLAAIDHSLLYARVDGIERGGRFILMELEINEPFLFLGYSHGAAHRFADAIFKAMP
jgi:hypothetical protein